MKLCEVSQKTVRIPVLRKPRFDDAVQLYEPVDFESRFVHLHPVQVDGKEVPAAGLWVAYDEPTDTLFVYRNK